MLDEIGRCDDQTVAPICEYLTAISTPDGGVPTVHPSIAPYPRAPWWPVEEDDPPASLLPTAVIVGLLHKNGVTHPWLEPATAFCWTAIGALTTTHPYEAAARVWFLDHAPDQDRAAREAERLGRLIREQRLVLLDPSRPDADQPPGYAPGECTSRTTTPRNRTASHGSGSPTTR